MTQEAASLTITLVLQFSSNHDEYQTLTGGKGKRDRGAEDIAILTAGTCAISNSGCYI